MELPIHVVDPLLNKWDGVLHVDVCITTVRYSDEPGQRSAVKLLSPCWSTKGGYNTYGFRNFGIM
jgi:hypothetical protein